MKRISLNNSLFVCIAVLLVAAGCAETFGPVEPVTEQTPLFVGDQVEATTQLGSEIEIVRTTAEPRNQTRLPSIDIDEIPRGENPVLLEEVHDLGLDVGLSHRAIDPDEVDGGLPTTAIDAIVDDLNLSTRVGDWNPPAPMVPSIDMTMYIDFTWYWVFMYSDYDGDCLVNHSEYAIGTDIFNPDTDGDGWFDGPCNERRRLELVKITADDEQEDSGDDEMYVIADDLRHPHGRRDLDSYWDLDDGDSVYPGAIIAERTRGTNTNGNLRNITVEGWEDDVEAWDTWTVDDLLFSFGGIDLGDYSNGQQFSRSYEIDEWWDNWDYTLKFKVHIEYFADPDPLDANADSDGDGIVDSAEFEVARDFGGITDPYRVDVLVEVDWMSGHGLNTESKRMVTTQYHRYGYDLFIYRDETIPSDSYLTRNEAEDNYREYFTFSEYDAFRYSMMTEEIWNDASGVASGDCFIVDDSTWWINGGVLAQAGTFIHELGHTMDLTSEDFHGIDTVASTEYDSAMNYLYQATRVDYSYNDESNWLGDDHDDWEDVDAGHALQYTFAH